MHVTWTTWTCLSTSAIIRTNIPSVSSAAEDAWQLSHGKDDKDAQKYKLVHADVSYQKLMMTMLFGGFLYPKIDILSHLVLDQNTKK